VIRLLGSTQTPRISLKPRSPGMLADRIAEELGMPNTCFYAAFSGALVVSALVGPPIGRTLMSFIGG